MRSIPHSFDHEVTDEAALVGARSGDSESLAFLWQRHHGAATGLARTLVGQQDVDDLVNETFANIFQALANGSGPERVFRPYLYTSMRRLASRWFERSERFSVFALDEGGLVDPLSVVDAGEEGDERLLVARAFSSLPVRWQEVLWYTEVEGMSAREVGPLLGMSANGVAALAYRARNGFRVQWLDAHIADETLPEICQWAVRELGIRGRRRAARDRRRLHDHVRGCAHCSAVAAGLDEVTHKIRVVLIPLFMGGAIGAAVVGVERPETAQATSVGRASTGVRLTGLSAGVAAIAVTVTLLSASTSSSRADPATPREPLGTSSAPADPWWLSSDVIVPTATAPDPQPSKSVPQQLPVAVALTVPTVDAIDPLSVVPPGLSGHGVPGSIVTITGLSHSGSVLVPVLSDGTWTTSPAGWSGPYGDSLLISQTSDSGQTSATTKVPLSFMVVFDSANATSVPTGSPFGFTASGWPGASYEVAIDGQLVSSGQSKQVIPSSGHFLAYAGVGVNPGPHQIVVTYVSSDHLTVAPAAASWNFTVGP